MSSDRRDSDFLNYSKWDVLCKYDTSHKLKFFNNGGVNDIYSSKYHQSFKSEPTHKKRFLSAYDLSEEDLQKFPTCQALRSYMQRIQVKYGCIPQLLDTKGISHLEDKKKHRVDYPSPSEDLIKEILQRPEHDILPVLSLMKTMLQSSICRPHYELAPPNTLVIMVQQGFSTVAPMIRALIELGVPKHNIVLFTKPHTTTPETRAIFESIGVNYVTGSVNEAEENGYNCEIKRNVLTVIEYASQRLAHQSLPRIQNIIVHDEGGVLLNNQDFSTFLVAQKETGYTISLSEHTVSGVGAVKNTWDRLNTPYISMALSWLKKDHESFFIAEESFDVAQPMISEHVHKLELEHASTRRQLNIGIIGCGGNIGSAFIECFIQFYAQNNKLKSFHLHINDIDTKSAKYLKTWQLISDHKISVSTHSNNCSLLNQSDLVFSCTGTDVITPEVYDSLSRSSAKHSVILCNLASGTREFKTLLDKCTLPQASSDYDLTVNNLSFIIKNRGRPIIFNGRKDAVHPFKIDIIRAGTLITLIQHFSYLSQAQSAKSSLSSDRVILLDAMLQYAICQSFILTQKIIKQKGLKAVNDTLLSAIEATDLNVIIKRSEGADVRQINVFDPSPVNLIGQFDKNHTIHYLSNRKNGGFDFCFIKHGKIISDPGMLRKFFEQRDESIDRFYAANFIDRFALVSTLCQRRRHLSTPLRVHGIWTKSNKNHRVMSNRQVLGKDGKEIDGGEIAAKVY